MSANPMWQITLGSNIYSGTVVRLHGRTYGQFSFVVNSAEMGIIAPRLHEDQVSISCSTHTRKRSRSLKTFVPACSFATSTTQCHHKLCVPGRHQNLHLLYVCWAITAGLLADRRIILYTPCIDGPLQLVQGRHPTADRRSWQHFLAAFYLRVQRWDILAFCTLASPFIMA